MRLKVTESMAHNMAELEDGCSVTAGQFDTEAFFKEVEQRADESASKEAHEKQKADLQEFIKARVKG